MLNSNRHCIVVSAWTTDEISLNLISQDLKKVGLNIITSFPFTKFLIISLKYFGQKWSTATTHSHMVTDGFPHKESAMRSFFYVFIVVFPHMLSAKWWYFERPRRWWDVIFIMCVPFQLASEVFHAALDNQIAIEPVCETSPKWVTSHNPFQ